MMKTDPSSVRSTDCQTNLSYMDSITTALSAAARRAHRQAGSLDATRESLLARIKDHADHEGWQQFFDTYGGVIHALARKAGLSDNEADDVLQETLLSVAAEMPNFRYDRNRGSFKGWLFLVTRRRIADLIRKRVRHERHHTESGGPLEELADVTSGPLDAIWEEEWRLNQLQLAVDRVKRRVSPRQWQMFDLAALQAWPTDRIIALLGVNRAQLYMAKMRIGRLLKAEIQCLDRD
jgi:RNA polymerase sigma factor (sigma-70 family)